MKLNHRAGGLFLAQAAFFIVLMAMSLPPRALAGSGVDCDDDGTCIYFAKGKFECVEANFPPKRSVQNLCPLEIMIPQATQAEWGSFINSPGKCAYVYFWNVSPWVGTCPQGCACATLTRDVWCERVNDGKKVGDDSCICNDRPENTMTCCGYCPPPDPPKGK